MEALESNKNFFSVGRKRRMNSSSVATLAAPHQLPCRRKNLKDPSSILRKNEKMYFVISKSNENSLSRGSDHNAHVSTKNPRKVQDTTFKTKNLLIGMTLVVVRLNSFVVVFFIMSCVASSSVDAVRLSMQKSIADASRCTPPIMFSKAGFVACPKISIRSNRLLQKFIQFPSYSDAREIPNSRYQLHNSNQILFSSPAKDSFHFQSKEIDEPSSNSIKLEKKREKVISDDKSSLPTEANSDNRVKVSGSPKEISPAMPPWLLQYEDDNLVESFLLGENEVEQIKYVETKSVIRVGGNDFEKQRHLSEEKQIIQNISDERSQLAPMHRLQLAMKGIFRRPQNVDDAPLSISTERGASSVSIPKAISYFSQSQISEVLDAIRVSSNSNPNLMNGCADFLYMMLCLEEEGVLTSVFMHDSWEENDASMSETHINFNDEKVDYKNNNHQSIMTRDVLVAAAFHYCDCVRARKAGVYDYVRKAMEASLDLNMWRELERRQELWLPPSAQTTENGVEALSTRLGSKLSEHNNKTNAKLSYENDEYETKSIKTRVSKRGKTAIESYGVESAKIAAGASRIKRAEIMASTVNSNGRSSTFEVTNQSSTSATSSTPSKKLKRSAKQSKEDAAIMRSFLVSLSDDWRALVIRSAACLYRLKGIVNADEDDNAPGSIVLTATTIETARDALRIYAPLAQRMGMQRLKSELENTAFRILYRRQHSIARSLYSRDIENMNTILNVLTSRIEQLLHADSIFMDQIERVNVSSRVKEPYSLWRKILRYRKSSGNGKNQPLTMSVRWIPDAIAFRVVLHALKLSPSEDDESRRTREKMLCYYALQLISNVWPASSANESKDYIQNPKKNGYQSLHYTASLMINGEEWPFEVQIRSEEMHRIAEFGVAAHWDYKLTQKKSQKALPQDLSSNSITSSFALPAETISNIKTTSEPNTIPAESNFSGSSTVNTTDLAATSVEDTVQKGRIASYIDALTTSRKNLVQDNLFVFLSSTNNALDGRIVSISPYSTVASVLEKYGVDADTVSVGGNKIYQNGVITSLDEKLSNGDVITLPETLTLQLNFDS